MIFCFDFILADKTIIWSWLDALIGVGIAILALITAKYIANLIEHILLYVTRKTRTLIDDNFVRAVISTFRIAALLFGFIGFFYFETKFIIEDIFRYDIIFIICIYFVFTVFGFKILNIGYGGIKKYAQPPKSYFDLNVLRAIFLALRAILVSVLILLAMQINGFPASVLWIIIAVLSASVFIFVFVIFYEASSAIFIRNNIPIKVGDIVRIDGNLGSVVEFGYRFIKLLTPENSNMYIPYKIMKDKLLENMTERQSRRFRYTMHLPWGVTSKEVEKFLKKANKFLVEHESILSSDSWKSDDTNERNEFGDIGNPFAYLVGMDDDGVEILIQYRIAETDFHLGAKISEKIVLGLMKLAEKEGVMQVDDPEKPEEKTTKTAVKKSTAKKPSKTEEKKEKADTKSRKSTKSEKETNTTKAPKNQKSKSKSEKSDKTKKK